MDEKLARQKRLCEFMDDSLDWITAKRYLYPDPELNIEDAITLADRVIEKYQSTTWQLIGTTGENYIGIIKTSEDVSVASNTSARALTLAADKFLEMQ